MYYYNQRDYGNVPYNRPNGDKKMVAESGCGVCAACIAINNLIGRELFSVASMAKFSVDNGGRDNYGTDMTALLNAICKKYPDFSYKTSNSETDLVNHIKKGGMVIINQGDSYNLFSTAGHFVTAVQMFGNDIVDIYDPDLYDGKYSSYGRENKIELATVYGARVKTDEIGKASGDRNPAYFLISYAGKKETAPIADSAPSFKVQNVYTLTANVRVRTGAGTNYAQKKKSELTADGQKNALNQTDAVLKSGTRFTVQEVKKVGSDIWVKIPSGWIAVYYQGDKYAD